MVLYSASEEDGMNSQLALSQRHLSDTKFSSVTTKQMFLNQWQLTMQWISTWTLNKCNNNISAEKFQECANSFWIPNHNGCVGLENTGSMFGDFLVRLCLERLAFYCLQGEAESNFWACSPQWFWTRIVCLMTFNSKSWTLRVVKSPKTEGIK